MARRRVARKIELARTVLVALGLLIGAMTSRGAAAWQAPHASAAQLLAIATNADTSRPKPNTETHLLPSDSGESLAFIGKRAPRPLPADGVGPSSIDGDVAFGATTNGARSRTLVWAGRVRSCDAVSLGTRATRGPPAAVVSMRHIHI